MRSRALTLLSVVTIAVVLLAGHAPAYGQVGATPIDSTHYWTYHLEQPMFAPSPIAVRDQFFLGYTPVTVDSLLRLVNWVIKNNSTVRDTLIHYTWWNIRDKYPVFRTVNVSNQFGDYPVTVENLEFLLAPAWKNQPRPGLPYANHYLCYRAHGFPGPGRSYFLRDEWRNDVQYPLPMEYLCVPCWKNHGGVVYPPIDTDTHLALYPITPTSEVFFPFVQDQFRQDVHYVLQRPFEYLMVPSTKVDPTPAKPSSWGRIKTLYR